MAERTNLIPQYNPIKYILGSISLIILTIGGILWLRKDGKTEAPATVLEEDKKEEYIVSPTPTEIIPSIIATPSIEENIIKTFVSENDFFKVEYQGKRKLYQDKEDSGKRYTFYDVSGNITVHVGTNWSWTYPDRVFSETLLVDGQNTFVYETSSQKIIDFEKNTKRYTIQCVHGGTIEIKDECQKFIDGFKFI